MALTFPTLGQAEDEAETAAQDRAEQLFQEGLAAADAGDFSGAAELFEQSYRLVQHPGMLLDMGLYQQESGRLVEAYASFTELLERFSGVISAETRDLTRSHLADLGHGSNEP
jgi:TolA-binding protein